MNVQEETRKINNIMSTKRKVFPRCTVSYCHDLQGATGPSNVWDAQILLQGL